MQTLSLEGEIVDNQPPSKRRKLPQTIEDHDF